MAAARPAFAGDAKTLVVFDNDWNGSGGYLGQGAIAPLLTSPRVKLLGLGSVSGDNWRDEGLANLLRFLEKIGATDLPVTAGAVFPLLNTREHLEEWEAKFGAQYGKILWKGAWNSREVVSYAHATKPFYVEPPLDGFPKIKPAPEDSVHFMIRMVHEHPHQVVLYEAGPMTNLALAVRIDPEFASLTKELVFMGGYAGIVRPPAGFREDDFNILFDPEAAEIVLSADWPHLISVADASDAVVFSAAVVQRLKAHSTRASDYIIRNSAVGYPMWDEVGALLVADPSLITRSEDMYMKSVTEFGPQYGSVVLTPLAAGRPRAGARVTIVQAVDVGRAIDEYVSAVTADRFR